MTGDDIIQQHANMSARFTRVIVTLCAAAALLCLDGQMGPLSFTTRKAIALATALAAVSLTVPRARATPWTWLVILAALAVVARAPSTALAVTAFVVALATLEIAANDPTRSRLIHRGMAGACLSYVALAFVGELIPQTRAVTDSLALAASRYISMVQGVEARLSFTALGGPPVGMAVLVLLWSGRIEGGIGRLVGAIVATCGWFAVLPVVTPDTEAGPVAPFLMGAAHGAFWLAVAAAASEFLPTQTRFPAEAIVRPRCGWMGFACLGAVSAGLCLSGTDFPSSPHKSIVVHNRGGLDWDRPVFGRFGAFSGGMFGLLPVYCRADSYEFSIIDNDAITASDLRNAQILVLINSPKNWEGAERDVVLDFVSRGGSLIVLGDHTDVFGLMRGFNSLLEPMGIRFRFDSAYKARENWRGCQRSAADGVAWGWDDENPGVAVGASLELHGWARPLLVGRYGFSDAGIRQNVMGSFLGNYHLDRGERLGDVVLAATTTLGRGRVMVWGDTSAFQGGLSTNYGRVVGPTLDWLARPAAWSERPWCRSLAAGGLLASMVVVVALARAGLALAVAASLLLGLATPGLVQTTKGDLHAPVDRDVVLIDRSHLPSSGHYEARINPVGPLYTNLVRSGFRVLDMDDWRGQDVVRARGVAFIAPSKPFRQDEIETLLHAEEQGKVVILAVGEPDAAGSRRLLEAHGLAIAARPLGTVSAVGPAASRAEKEKHPRFLDAWPIVTVGGEDPAALAGVDVLQRSGDDVVALFRARGRGGLLLISDTRFFSDMNVEDVYSSWPGNLAFIHDQFKRYLGADPDAVAPLFRSPEKPR